MNRDPYAPIAELYDFEHEGFQEDIPFYQALARRTGGVVLEVGCGSGRITTALGRAGLTVIGVDPSPVLLERARQRSAGLATVRYLAGEATALPLDEPIGLAIFALDTFAHLLEGAAQLRALAEVRRLLTRRGRLVIDLSLPDPATWRQEEGLLVHAWTRRAGTATVQKCYARHLDELAQQQKIFLCYDRWPEGEAVHRVSTQLRLRFFYPPELTLLLRLSRFEPEGWYGDYDLTPLEEASARLIVIARPVGRAPRGGGDVR
ncbi:MAG: class I SAM-dependent methyltransferase [Firmicutes bacterium]|nr:class I SAM-dependent methyltransferase [Bacillota bacterium]